jgi:hypothetical protein
MMKPIDRYLPYRKFELIIPVFLGCLLSLILNAFLMKRSHYVPSPIVESEAIVNDLMKENPVEAESVNFFFTNKTERRDPILELYRDVQAQDRVIDFFAGIGASPEIVEVILASANSFNISPALAFALAWEESRLNPYAVNNKNRDGSIDRGLFQLNSLSFPRLEIHAFFNPGTNARYGMSHLRHCLDVGGSEIAALAMYNAGTNRVNSSGTPKSTLDYVSRIMDNRREIEHLFQEQETLFQEEQLDDFSEVAEVAPERPRLVPLMPLAGLK